jgi:hypothetical protein
MRPAATTIGNTINYDVLYDCGMEGLAAEQYNETCFENADGIKDECEDI